MCFSSPKVEPPPQIAAPVPMPEPDDAAAVRNRKRVIEEARNRSGRVSTILSEGTGETLG